MSWPVSRASGRSECSESERCVAVSREQSEHCEPTNGANNGGACLKQVYLRLGVSLLTTRTAIVPVKHDFSVNTFMNFNHPTRE